MLAVACLTLALLYAPSGVTAPGDLADLSVSKTDSPDPVFVGATLTYSIQVANIGPQGATGVTVTDKLPKRTSLVSATSSSGSCSDKGKGRQVVCEVGDLDADPSKSNAVNVTIQVRPTKAGTVKNKVSVESVEDDPISVNDKAETSTTVQAAPQASSCRGVTATLTGTPRSDRLVGTGGPDVIAGLRGRDVIAGIAGRDLICAGGGSDRVTAGSAADRVFGGAGGDRLHGLRGRDLLAGNAGPDVIVGNLGSDRLRGGRGFDLCYGGAGIDRERGCER
jgi:uncharacterized repeat protein (TIGR01451 family)